MTSKFKNSQKGFTLVELAIVLVIIGLIVSGVLVGQDLIKAAELRATVRQHQSFQVGVNTFIGKYNGIPGDIDGDKFGLTGGCNGTANAGDGDGIIEDSAGAITLHDSEISCFWSNLTTNGKELISGVYDGDEGAASATVNDVVGENLPKMKFGSRGWGVFFVGTDNYFTTGVIGANALDEYDTAEAFVPIDAFSVDSKIDDGDPFSGDIQATDGQIIATPNPNLQAASATFAAAEAAAPGTVNATSCANRITSAPDEYQFTATTALCNLRFKMQTF